MRGNAIVRALFGKEPDSMTDEEWSQHVADGIYITQLQAKMIAAEVSKIFGSPNK